MESAAARRDARNVDEHSFLPKDSENLGVHIDSWSFRALQLVIRVCRPIAASPSFSAVTTILTIYALFGDDIRLWFTDKPADPIFDAITITSMVIFGLEILVCSAGKPGYIFGFFFFLDLLSTLTLLLDVTTISENLFGDSISKNSDNDEGGNSGGADDSAEAARAARMSRAGTKAGRVVRLIRLMRLIRLFKAFKKTGPAHYQAPGEDWTEDWADDGVEKESAVSKKLSEMTTRRVIALVLTIMLLLPFFSAEMYRADLPSSAQYGASVLFRRLWEDLSYFGLTTSSARVQEYYTSSRRLIYEDDFLIYVYYHNWFCDTSKVDKYENPSPYSSFARLFWIGGAPTDADIAQYFLPSVAPKGWDSKWNGAEWQYYQCDLPQQARDKLTMNWNSAPTCVNGRFRGVALASSGVPSCPEDLRWQERTLIYPNALTNEEASFFRPMFVFDRRTGARMEAALNIAQTFFICLLLGVGAMTFSNDANQLVLMPIEKIIAKLEKIRNNPLEAMTIGDEEHHREQVLASKKKQVLKQDDHAALMKDLTSTRSKLKRLLLKLRWLKPTCITKQSRKQVVEPMETVVLEKTIIKIGSLLALGFGEAGAEIIGQNMQGSETSALNAMIPGRRVEALFGFCDIRNFTDATEVLQDQVMVFVNRIAGVVHSCINEFFGNPNKNIGDAFLLVWRLSGQSQRKQQRLADMSVISFVKIIATINKSPLLAEYRSHPKLVKRLPNYRVRLGFGLHSGWAIEGAIGSDFKIDASYLSPNVNMAARLEGVTKQYGCLILISDALVSLTSEQIAQECRLIDHVAMIGNKQSFKLFTLDLDDLALEVDWTICAIPVGKQAKFKARYERQRRKKERWSDDFCMVSLFENDKDINTMRHKFTVEFFCRFNMAYLNYEAGNWPVAKTMLETTRFLLATEDGPSASLLRYMKQHCCEDGYAPKGWQGFRVLNDK